MRPVEVEQVIQQGPHSRPARDQAGRRLRDVLSGIQRLKVSRRDLHRLKRIAQVVTQDAEQQVAGLLDFGAEESDRLGKGLIDRLVEANHVTEIGLGRFPELVGPKAQYACAQRTVLGRQLPDVEAAARTQHGVGLGGRFRRIQRLRESLGLVELLLATLMGRQVGGDRPQDLLGVVTQRQRAHSLGRRQLARGKRFPFDDDRLEVGENEISQSHGVGPSA